nr:MAG TPA: Chromosome region maintenance protein [Caudoviricetes sp.]
MGILIPFLLSKLDKSIEINYLKICLNFWVS